MTTRASYTRSYPKRRLGQQKDCRPYFRSRTEPFRIGPGVASENIEDSPCGTRRDVVIWPDWSAIYSDLSRLNDLLIVMPSPVAILGAIWKSSAGPGLATTCRPHEFFQGLCIGQSDVFHEFRATEEIREKGRSFSISGIAPCGKTALKIILRSEKAAMSLGRPCMCSSPP